MQFTELHSPRRHGAPASRDTAEQLAAICRFMAEDTFAQALHAVIPMEAPMPRASTAPDTICSADLHQHFIETELDNRMQWARSLAGDTRSIVLRHLERAAELGPMRRVARPPSHEAIDALERDFPHCVAVTDLLRRRIALGHCCPSPALQLPPLLISGAPGTGKSAFAKRLAAALAVPCSEIDMASVRAAFTLGGLDVGYTTGRPGAVWDAMQTSCMSPVIILDELDKSSHGDSADDPAGALYSLLEPLTACRYIDAALGLAVDASWVFWLATCNDPGRINPAILSRFRLVAIDTPTTDQMPAVVASIHSSLLSRSPWAAHFDQTLTADVVRELSSLAPRQVSQTLEDAYSNAANAGRRCLLRADIQAVKQPGSRGRSIGFLSTSTNHGGSQ